MDGPEYDGRSFLHDDRERGSRGRRPFLLVIYICHLLWFLWVAVSQFFRWLVLSLDREYLNPYGIYLRLQGLALDSAGVLISGFVILVIACLFIWLYRIVLRFPRHARQKLYRDLQWSRMPTGLKCVIIYGIFLFLSVAVPVVLIMAVIACVVCGMFCGLLVPGWFLAGRMFAYMRDTLYFGGNGGGL